MDNYNQEEGISLDKKATEVLSKDLAIAELIKFVGKNEDRTPKDWEIEKDYPQALRAMQDGYLTFDEKMHPHYRLKYPILNDEKEVAVNTVEFRTRIKPQQLADIMKGLNIVQNQIEYTLRCLSYIIKQPKAMLDKFEKFDYRVIEQISTVFM